MKGSQIIGMLGVCLFNVTLSAYQIGEPGLFAFISKGEAGAVDQSQRHMHHHQDDQMATKIYEKKSNGQKSNVMLINGLVQFNKQVIEASRFKPVVVKIHSIHSSDSQKIREPFQETAEKFKNMVSFVALDLFKQHADKQENYHLVGSLMASMKIYRIDLPVILFFRNGNLYSPLHASGAMLQGFYNRDDLSAVIQEKFFSPRVATASQAQVIMPSSSPVKQLPQESDAGLSLTTTTSGSRLPAGNSSQPADTQKKNSDSWWNRIKNIFKQ